VKSVDEAPVLGPELWAALVGAAVAGIIGVITQYIVIWDNKKRRDEERRETQVALARSVIIKTIRIQGNFYNQLEHIFDGTALAEAHGASMRYQTIRPLGNLPDIVEFKPEELALIASLGGGPLMDEYMSLDSRHNSLHQLWALYQANRKQWESEINPTSFDGVIGSTAIPIERFMQLKGAMVSLDDLINQLEGLIWGYLEETTSMLEELVGLANSKLGTALKMQYKERHRGGMERFREVMTRKTAGLPQG